MTEHCKLCHHSKFNASSGTICGITNQKPNFSSYCPQYLEDPEAPFFIKKLKKELEDPRLKKSNLINTVILRSIIGLLIIIGTYQFWKHLNSKIATEELITSGKVVAMVFLLYSIGTVIITSGIATYRHFTNIRKYAELNLNKHLKVFKYYQEREKSNSISF